MDDIISKIVEVDHDCHNRVELAKNKQKNIAERIKEKKSAIYEEQLKLQKEKIEETKKILLNKYNQEQSSKEALHIEKLKKLDDKYESNKDKYLKDLLVNIIGGE